MAQSPIITELRQQIALLDGVDTSRRGVLPFGIPEMDQQLPGGGLALGVVHEVTGGGDLGVVHIAAATLFVAGILARMTGPVLWCLRGPDLFAPALCQAGLDADRVVFAESPNERTLPLLVEEGLRHHGLTAVVGELARISLVTSRRLQIAAEHSGVTALLLRRWRTAAAAQADIASPTAAVTRWRITAMPSNPLPAPGLGRPRWQVDLVRCRGGRAGSWEVEGCDETGHLRVPADMGHRQAARGASPVHAAAGSGIPGNAARRAG